MTEPGAWVAIGTVSTETGTFALLDPAMFRDAARSWRRHKHAEDWVNFQQIDLPDPWDGLLLATQADAEWTVEATFCPDCGTGPPVLCVVRLRLHGHDQDDDDAT